MNEDIMRAAGFGKQLDLIKQGLCPMCEKKLYVSELRTEIERNEYRISGMCHKCQTIHFKKDGSPVTE